MTTLESWTLAIAILGAVLGVYNAIVTWSDRRVRLRVEPGWAIAPGFQGLSIDVINVSAFTVEIVEVGFLLDGGRGALPKRVVIPARSLVNGAILPVRLDAHDKASFVFETAGLDTLSIRKAYARTSSGVIKRGDSPALRQFITETVRR